MQFEPGKRRLVIGAREFVVFGVPGRAGREAGIGESGAAWCAKIRARAAAESPAWRFDTPVTLHRAYARWALAIEARVDAWRVEGTRVLVRVVRVVEGGVDAPPAVFLKRHPTHFRELAVACEAVAALPEHTGKSIVGEVLYVDAVTGATLAVRPEVPATLMLEHALDAVTAYAEDRYASRERLSALRFRRAHDVAREGWEQARADLDEASARAKVVLLEAPTGFGKTALALDFALARLRDGLCDRVLYLTGKNSGRIQVVRELDRMTAPGAIRALDLRRRDDHAMDGDEPVGWRDRWSAADFDTSTLFNDGLVSLERIREAGARLAVPPWEITRSLLGRAELVIADFNHVFSPGHATLLRDTPGYDASRTLLIVDEAHHLPDRAAEARALVAELAVAERTLMALETAGAHRDLRGAWAEWVRFLDGLDSGERLTGADEHTLHDVAKHLADTLRAVRLPWDLLTKDDRAAIEDAGRWAQALVGPPDEFLLHAPEVGMLRLDPLHAERDIAEALAGSGGALLMSATLAPHDAFAKGCGLAAGEVATVVARAPWRDGAYKVLVDTRADTRYASREKHYALTAEAVVNFAGEGVSAVFFPSYRYAEAIATYVRALSPGFRVAMQPRGGSPESHTEFMEEAILGSHALFLVLGGSLAEGVDVMGGRVSRAMIVGPAIPDTTSPLQKARHARLREESGDKAAFRLTSILPGMRKVNQALGRLVRAPGQTAVVMLHCKRFADPEHAAFLAPEYRRRS